MDGGGSFFTFLHLWSHFPAQLLFYSETGRSVALVLWHLKNTRADIIKVLNKYVSAYEMYELFLNNQLK